VLDPGGEQVTIVDDEGHILSDDEAVLVLLTLVTDAHPGARVALPVAVSLAAEEICRRSDTEIVWTKLATSHLMEVASTEDVILGVSQHAGFIFPGFMPAFDAAATLVNLLALLTRTGRPLSDLVRTLPRVHIAHQSVHTPWEQKGTVMRNLVEHSEGRDLVLVDGVKVLEPDGWALILPDPEEPVTHVWAEAGSDAQAGARAQEYAVRIRQLLR